MHIKRYLICVSIIFTLTGCGLSRELSQRYWYWNSTFAGQYPSEDLYMRGDIDEVIAEQPDDIRILIKTHKIQMGMNRKQVLLSWGSPSDINRSVGAWGVNEQWVYGSGSYLYFENGILTSWQD